MGHFLIIGMQHFCEIKEILNYCLCINLGHYNLLFLQRTWLSVAKDKCKKNVGYNIEYAYILEFSIPLLV